MDKKTALAYIVGQGKRVTAKQLSIDVDAPISTTTELLERMSAQGLLERDRDQRPREYAITEEGRKRLEFFKARDAAETHSSEHNLDGNAGASASGVAPSNPASNGAESTEKFDALREEVCSRLDALREDFRGLLDVLAANPSSAASALNDSAVSSESETSLSRADRQLARLKKPAEEREDSDRKARIQKLLDAHIAAERGGLFSSGRLRTEAEAMEPGLDPEVVADVRRLAELAAFTRFASDAGRAEIARLRGDLGLDSHSPESLSKPLAQVGEVS